MPFSHTKTKNHQYFKHGWKLPLTTGQPPWKKGFHLGPAIIATVDNRTKCQFSLN